MKPYPPHDLTFARPSLKGGQGRSREDVNTAGRIVGWCFLIGAVLFWACVLALVVWA